MQSGGFLEIGTLDNAFPPDNPIFVHFTLSRNIVQGEPENGKIQCENYIWQTVGEDSLTSNGGRLIVLAKITGGINYGFQVR